MIYGVGPEEQGLFRGVHSVHGKENEHGTGRHHLFRTDNDHPFGAIPLTSLFISGHV